MRKAGFVSGIDDGEDAVARCVLAGYETGAGRGAGVGLAKDDALFRERVGVGRIDKIATREPHVAPTHIVDKNDNEVWFGEGG